jgi:hypothetical protein
VGTGEAMQVFPTPLEEPKAAIRCQYVGHIAVDRPTGQ